jgi:hypothetical protein
MIAKKVTTESLEKKAVTKQVIKKTSASKDTNSVGPSNQRFNI